VQRRYLLLHRCTICARKAPTKPGALPATPQGTPETNAEHHKVVVIGAGQAGLSVGYHLKRRGINHIILDGASRIGDVWRNRWDSLRLSPRPSSTRSMIIVSRRMETFFQPKTRWRTTSKARGVVRWNWHAAISATPCPRSRAPGTSGRNSAALSRGAPARRHPAYAELGERCRAPRRFVPHARPRRDFGIGVGTWHIRNLTDGSEWPNPGHGGRGSRWPAQ
jgi:hypothetical protein